MTQATAAAQAESELKNENSDEQLVLAKYKKKVEKLKNKLAQKDERVKELESKEEEVQKLKDANNANLLKLG